MRLTKRNKQQIKSVAAIAIALFYCGAHAVNDVPKQLARQDELETRVEVSNDGATIY